MRHLSDGRRPPAAPAVLLAIAAAAGACSSTRTPRLLAEGRPAASTFDAVVQGERRTGLLVVPVSVGDRQLRFLLDSGAPTAITPVLRRQLGLPVLSRTRAADARRTETSVDVVRLPRVSIGGVGFDRIAAVVLDVTAVPDLRCLRIDGLLGANLMRQAVWQIDLGRGRLRLVDRADRLDIPAGSRMARFITQDSGAPLLRPVLDGVPILDMVLDTGANVDVLAPTETLDAMPAASHRPRAEARGSSGAAALGYGSLTGTTRFVAVDRIEIGQLLVRNRLVEFREEASLLGTRFLRDYLVSLDWRRREAWFTPRQTGGRAPTPGFGFQVILRGDRLVASLVIVDSPAWEAGLRPGSVIVAADGESLAPIAESRYCEILESGLVPESRGRLHLSFLQDGTRRTVELTPLPGLETRD